MTRLDEGRNEPIIDPELPIVDAHHHLFDSRGLRYLFDDVLADVNAGHNVVATVYVEARASMWRRDGPELLRPLGEVEFANGMAAMSASGQYGPCRVAAAIVGHADLTAGDRVVELLDQALAAAPDRLRGIRQYTADPAGILDVPGFLTGIRLLAPRGLVFDAVANHRQLPGLGELAAAVPSTTIVLNHLGLATPPTPDAPGRAAVFGSWRAGLRDVAQHPNVVCKIGGLGMTSWGFGFESRPEPVSHAELASAWRPYVETAIEAFGVERCMLESNYPPDSASTGYVPLWNAFKLILKGASSAERAALFHGTATRVYRLTAPGVQTRSKTADRP